MIAGTPALAFIIIAWLGLLVIVGLGLLSRTIYRLGLVRDVGIAVRKESEPLRATQYWMQ
jgi:hypothetical protein